MSTGPPTCASRSACSRPSRDAQANCSAGEVGFVIAGIKELKAAQVGDTLTLADGPPPSRCRASRKSSRRCSPGLYPVESNEYEALRDALEKLHLNDSSLRYEPETSQALGFGFRCGFLGLLHMDIVQERLEREYDMDLITTAPTVVYQVLLRDGTVMEIENPSKLPDPSQDRGDPRADHHGDDPRAAGLRRRR